MFIFFPRMSTWSLSLEGCPFLLGCGGHVGLTSALCSGPLAFSLGPPVVLSAFIVLQNCACYSCPFGFHVHFGKGGSAGL